MGINKVQYGNTVLIDLTSDTVTADKLTQGYTAHDRTGALITGTATGGSGDGYVWQDGNGYVHLSDEQGTQTTIDALTVDASGIYTAQTGHAYSPVTVPSGSASTPATSVTANPSISVSSGGLITATASATKSVTPSVSAGWVSSGTAGTITVSGSNTSQLSTEAGKTVTPTESEQTAVASGKYTTGAIKVGAISSSYVGSGITRRDSTDLSASGATVSVPSGYYESNASKSVSSGTEGTPTATKGAVSNHSISVTPSVTNSAGYISGGTHTGTAVTVSASELASGNKSITENGTDIDVVGYSTVSVSVGGSGGLVYEEGTWTPSEDVADYTISFVNAHTTAPFYYMIMDVGTTYNSTSNSNAGVIYYNWGQAFGEPLHYSSSSVRYGYARKVISSGGNTSASITYPHTSTTDTSASYPRYWAKETGIKADAYSSGYYWRAGRTYKWIAVWAPTT